MDFTCSLSTMQQQIYSRAHEMGVKVSARRVHNDGLLVRADRSVARTASNAKYDWPKLLDGEVHTLILGRDITSKSASFKVYARQVAHDKGFGLQIRTMGNQLLLKAIPRDQEPKKGQPAIPLEPPVDRLSNPLPFDLPFKVTQ